MHVGDFHQLISDVSTAINSKTVSRRSLELSDILTHMYIQRRQKCPVYIHIYRYLHSDKTRHNQTKQNKTMFLIGECKRGERCLEKRCRCDHKWWIWFFRVAGLMWAVRNNSEVVLLLKTPNIDFNVESSFVQQKNEALKLLLNLGRDRFIKFDFTSILGQNPLEQFGQTIRIYEVWPC